LEQKWPKDNSTSSAAETVVSLTCPVILDLLNDRALFGAQNCRPFAGWRAFADEQMQVIGHNHVSHQQELVTFTNLPEGVHEEISRPPRLEQRQAPIATGREEVQISVSIVAFQTFRHN
jgi:hypothetical protein